MIERYTPPEIGKIWTDQEKFQRFLKIEALLCEALEKAKAKLLSDLQAIGKASSGS